MSSQIQLSLLLLAIPILLLLFSIRGRWLHWKNEDHQLKTVWYCWRTGQQESVLLELLEIWPTRTMLLELWNWNFDRYIIHHDHLEEMKKFIARELTRDDINLDMMRQAQLQYSNRNKPEDPTSSS